MAILTTTNQGLNFIGGTTFIQTGTTTVMSIKTDGNVGIGTTSPSSKLEVNGGTSNVIAKLTSTDAYSSLAFVDNTTTGENVQIGAFGNDLVGYAGGYEKIRAINFDGSTVSSNSFNSVNLRLVGQGKTGWGVGDVLGQLSFYNTDASGIGARNAASIMAICESGNGTTTTTFSSGLGFFVSGNNVAEAEKMRLSDSGSLRLHGYDSTNKTGTPTYLLGTDGSGNVVKTNTGNTPVGSNIYTMPSTTGSSAWKLLGRFTANNGGRSIFIKMVTNAGYNASIDQNAEVYIRFKTSNGSSVDANGFSGDSSFYTIGAYSGYPGGNIKWKSNAAGTAATSYELYINMPSYSGVGGFYSVENTNGTWTPLNSAATDPGAASSTILLPTKQFKVGGSDLVVGAGGANSYFANSNVGIGTTSPGEKLTVAGNIEIAVGAASAQGIIFNENGTQTMGIKYQGGQSGNPIDIFRYQDNTTKVRFLENGNVGIGTTSPSKKLEVVGTIRSNTNGNRVTGNINIGLTTNNTTKWSSITGTQYAHDTETEGFSIINGLSTSTLNAVYIGGALNEQNAANEIGFYTTSNTTTRTGSIKMKINESGNVGIGTTSPDGKLDISESSGPTSLYMNNLDTAQTATGDVQNQIIMKGLYWSGSSTSQLVETRINSVHQLPNGNGGSALTFMTQTGGSGVVEQMRIDRDGNVGIGTAGPTAKLHVAGTGLFTGLVSGITPVAAANFVTKAYVDGSGGGTGPFLPLAGGTMDSSALIGGSGTLELGGSGVTNLLLDSDGVNIMQLVNASASLQYAQIISNEDKVRLRFRDGMDIYYDDTAIIDYMKFHALGSHTTQFKNDNFEIIGIGTNNDEMLFKAEGGGAVSLYHNNVLQLNTTSTGIATNTIDATVSAGSAGDFVVMDGTRLVSRTAAQVLSDIGGTSSSGVTSITKGAGLVVAGSPITTTGSVAVEYAANVQNIVTGGNNFIGDTVVSTDQILITEPGVTSTNRRVGRVVIGDLPFTNNTGTVTSIATTAPILGGTITSTGTISLRTPVSGNWFNGGAIVVGGDGLIEVGRYIDFHNSNTGTTDFDARLDCYSAGNLQLTGNFKSTGNVLCEGLGVGINPPREAIEVYGSSSNIAITNTAETDAGIIFRDSGGIATQAAAIKFNSADQKLKFFVNDETAQRMVIDTSGNVGIGTSTPDYKLEVDGTMFSSGNFGNRNSAQTIGVQFEPGSTTATTMAVYSDELKIYYKGPNTTRFELEESGTARKPGGGSWSSTSDKRVKKDITNYTKGLTEILAIQPVNYKYNGKAGLPKEKQQVGVVAQDIQAAFPNAVETYKALFNNDDTEETELLAFNPSELTFTLINAVKELKAEIELLKQQINN